jgi:glutamate-ammonia-ligase adenylyltransferase
MGTELYFDEICPGIPDTDAVSQAVLAGFAETLRTNWPETDATEIDLNSIARMLAASPYLQRLAIRYVNDIPACLNGNMMQRFSLAKADFIASIADATDEATVMRAVRVWRGRSALIVALGDISGLLSMDEQMTLLSEAADCVLNHTIDYLFSQASKRDKVKLASDGVTTCGWTILALGKLGAGELNFSSDIDLIVLHDSTITPVIDANVTQRFFVKMTRDLIRILGTPTGDGIGWRVDLRLRPDPGATAVSIDVDAAIGYYESIARTWERAAFIRARPVAGDIALGKRFLKQIQPFVWRKTLDYTVMEDMKTMLRRPPLSSGWLGYNLKSGKNGIRHIEFFTHVLQLVTGGRDPALRHRKTVNALKALAERNWITSEQATVLTTSYYQLRRAEHRLQMIGDSQTHSLPRSHADLEKFAHFMGHASSALFTGHLDALLNMVANHTRHDLLDPTNDPAKIPTSQSILLDDYDALVSWLEDHGFVRPKIVANTLSGWMAGRIPATRGDRARALLNRLMPDILVHFTAAGVPDDKFAALAQFIEGLPASVQIFSLLDYNRHLTRLLCDMLLLSPHLGSYLRQNPMLFDLLLYPTFFEPLPDTNSMVEILRNLALDKPVENALDAIKTQTREWKFRIQVQALSQTIDSSSLGHGLSAIASANVMVILDLAKGDMERRHGTIDGAVGVIALGGLGTKQMTVSSDIDLLILFDAPDNARSTGTKPLGAPSYFTRLAQTMISWLGTPTAEGVLYTVDLRLRPEGEAGSIATSLERFKVYFASDAWLWEKLALTKARAVAGDKDLISKIEITISGIVNHSYKSTTIATAIAEMLARIHSARKAKSNWHLRALDGGLTDLDLLVQGLRLLHGDLFVSTGQSRSEILDWLKTNARIDDVMHETLSTANSLYNELHQCLRLTFGNAAAVPEILPPPLANFMLTRMDLADTTQLALLIKASRGAVEGAVRKLLKTNS